MNLARTELLIETLSRLIDGARVIAVGASSPIPAAAALLVRERHPATRVLMLGSRRHNAFTDGGRELFDSAAQGRIDAFFLGGGQIDGQANINLVGLGDPLTHRFPGSFGSAYMYFVVPNVILFREEHSARVLVPKVDFISAPGVSPPNVHRPGGPKALVTGRCVFAFKNGRFALASIHPGESTESIRAATGFDYDAPSVPETPGPDVATRAILRDTVRAALSETYPRFAAEWTAAIDGKTS